MTIVRVVFLGTGDAFSAHGSHQASYLVQSPRATLLLDCGPATLSSLKRDRISASPIDAILLSHLHGDHFAGLPFLFLEYTYEEPRQRPLLIAGPPGTRKRVLELHKAMYPDVRQKLPFELDFIEMLPEQRLDLGSAIVEPFRVPHQQKEISLGLSVELEGRRIVYSGDSGWTDELIARSKNADLFICECSFYETRIPSHLDYPRLAENRRRFRAKRMILTHLGREVQVRRPEIDMELAGDSLIVEL
jgi:ribonuclease BN (tRNA processing enzyme)